MDGRLIILFVSCALLIFLITRIGVFLEKKSFNNGRCICCGNTLRLFDYDSQGGRGYTCDCCKYKTWVSYPCVDKRFRESREFYQGFRYIGDDPKKETGSDA